MLALRDLLKPDHQTVVLSVGAAPDERPCYQRMLEEGLCEIGSLNSAPDYCWVTGGAELGILHARPKLVMNAVALQCRMDFLVIDAPPIGMVDTALRTEGFIPHCFVECTVMPILTDPPLACQPNQITAADMLYVRDYRDDRSDMFVEQWKQLALIAHHICGSYDLALRAVTMVAELEGASSDAPQRYRDILAAQ